MRAATFFILLFLLAGCSWADFDAGVQKVVHSLTAVGGVANSTKEAITPSEMRACGNDDRCLKDAVSSCSPARGFLSDNGTRVEMMVNVSGGSCVLNWTIIAGPGKSASLWCVFPFSKNASLERVIDPASGYCEGSWYGIKEPYVNLTGPFVVPAVSVGASQLSFNITPEKNLYIQSILLAGPRLQGCVLSYKNPVKVMRGVQELITIDCTVIGRAEQVSGMMAITYFERPDFKNASVVTGSFVT